MITPKIYRLPDNTKPVIEEYTLGDHWRPVAWVPADELREARELLGHFRFIAHGPGCTCEWCERRDGWMERMKP